MSLKNKVSFVTQQLIKHTKNGVQVNDKLRVTLPCAELAELSLSEVKARVSAQMRAEHGVDFAVEAFESSSCGKVQATYQITSAMTGNELMVSGFVKTPEYHAQLDELKEEKKALDELVATKANRTAKIDSMKNELRQLEADNQQDDLKITHCQSRLFALVAQLKPQVANNPAVNGAFFGNANKAAVAKVAQTAQAVAHQQEANLVVPVA